MYQNRIMGVDFREIVLLWLKVRKIFLLSRRERERKRVESELPE